MREFFHMLEGRYGNLSDLFDRGPSGETIVSSTSYGDGILRTEDLARLFRHEATALHVPNFYHRGSASRLGEELIRESSSCSSPSWRGGRNWKVSTSRGLESSDVYTLGEHMPYNVAVASSASAIAAGRDIDDDDGGRRGGGSRDDYDDDDGYSSTDDYFEGVRRELRIRRLRWGNNDAYDDDQLDIEYPGGGGDDGTDRYRLWPLDKLRLELDEAWPGGAGLAREDERAGRKGGNVLSRPFGGGLPRIMRGPTRWKRGFVHVDELGPLNPESGLFTANIYLTMPNRRSLPFEGISSSSSSGASAPPPSDSGALYIWPLGVRTRWDWYRVSYMYIIYFFSFHILFPPVPITDDMTTPTHLVFSSGQQFFFTLFKNAVTLSSLTAQDPEMQLNLHRVLGKPNVIRPKPGDLVLFCAQRVSVGTSSFYFPLCCNFCFSCGRMKNDVTKLRSHCLGWVICFYTCVMPATLRGWIRRRCEAIITVLFVS
jgi:hypothetical protein